MTRSAIVPRVFIVFAVLLMLAAPARALTTAEAAERDDYAVGAVLWAVHHELAGALGLKGPAQDAAAAALLVPSEPDPRLDAPVLAAFDALALLRDAGAVRAPAFSAEALPVFACRLQAADPRLFGSVVMALRVKPAQDCAPPPLPEPRAASVTVVYGPAGANQAAAAAAVRRSGLLEAVLSRPLPLDGPLEVSLGTCGERGAWYDTRARRIVVCWELVGHVVRRAEADILARRP